MNLFPLSVSIPKRGSGKHSAHPAVISVNVSVFRKHPFVLPPQWATKSASRKPGITFPPSAIVLTCI